jgi:hypothetical protein
MRHHYNIRTNTAWLSPQDKPKSQQIKFSEHERELLIRAVEHMVETYLDLMKGLNSLLRKYCSHRCCLIYYIYMNNPLILCRETIILTLI